MLAVANENLKTACTQSPAMRVQQMSLRIGLILVEAAGHLRLSFKMNRIQEHPVEEMQ